MSAARPLFRRKPKSIRDLATLQKVPTADLDAVLPRIETSSVALPESRSRPDYVVALTRPDIDRVGKESCVLREQFAISGDYFKWPSVDMHRVDEIVVGADEPKLHRLSDAHADHVGHISRRVKPPATCALDPASSLPVTAAVHMPIP